MEVQMMSLAQRENTVSASAATSERKLQVLEEETQSLRTLRTRLEA
jgi:hypothetical protein